jgi:predicted dehydrogenase
MVAAASFAGVKLFLNWPSSWQPPLQHAIKLAREGFIGQVYEARYRGGHTGPRDIGCSPYFYSWLYDAELNGGGASADYLGYGTGFVYDVLGMPSAVVGLAGRLVQDYITVDDNARLLLEYHRAMGLVEGSWTQARPLPGAAAICGTEGNLVVEYGGDLTLYRRGMHEPEPIAAPPLPEGARSGPEAFLGAIMRDEPITGPSSPLRGRDIQEVVEAGFQAIRTGRKVSLPLPPGAGGGA